MSFDILSSTRGLLETRFAVEWSEIANCPIQWENIPFEAPTYPEWQWIAFQVKFGEGGIASLGRVGNRMYRQSGVILVTHHIPKDIGMNDIYLMLEHAAELYRHITLASGTLRVKCRDARIVSTTTNAIDARGQLACEFNAEDFF